MALPDAPADRALDGAAVRHALRRLAAAAEPPWLHAEVARRMAERLVPIRHRPTRVVEWSGWLGAGGSLLSQAYPEAVRVVVEPDAQLLGRSQAAAAAPWWSARRWREAAPLVQADSAPLPGAAGLVWSNMLLHAVANPPALLARWEAALAAEGFVMFSCLGPGSLAELRALYAAAGWGAPTQGFIDMHDLGDMLVHAGFADPVMDQETLELSWADGDALLAELRALGGNAEPQRHAGLRTPRWRMRLVEALQTLAGADGRPRLRFEIAYGHAFKAAPRLRAGAPTTVSLDDMRALVKAGRGPT